MNDVTLPGLIVPVEARIDRLERALKRANAAQAGAAKEMEARAKQSADKMGRTYETVGTRMSAVFTKVALPFAGGFLAGGAAAFLGSARQIVTGIAEIGDAAKRAGVDAEAFQELSFVARENRVAVDALTDGLKEMNLRADEFITTGAGSAADAFRRIGYDAGDLRDKLKDPSALMLEIIGRLEKLDKAPQIRISDEIFGGTGGEQFVQLLDKGEAAIQAQIDRAHEMGAVLDEDLIARAAELDRKFGEVQTRVGNLFKGAIVDAATMVGLVERARDALPYDPAKTAQTFGPELAGKLDVKPEVSEPARDLIYSTGEDIAFVAAEARNLAVQLSDAAVMLRGLGDEAGAMALTDAAQELQGIVAGFEEGTVSGEEMAAKLGDVSAALEDAVAGMGDLDKARLSGVSDAVAGLLGLVQAIPKAVADAKAQIETLEGIGTGPAFEERGRNGNPPEVIVSEAGKDTPRPRTAPAMLGEPDAPRVSGGGGGGAGGGGDPFGDAVADLQRETRALEAEAAALAATAVAGQRYGNSLEFARTKAELLVAAQEAGKSLTPELVAEIDKLAASYTRAGEEAEAAGAKMEASAQAGQAGADALSNLFMTALTGGDMESALSGMLTQAVSATVQNVFTGMLSGGAGASAGGGGANFLTMLMGGGAGGGDFLTMLLQLLGSFLTGVPLFAEGGFTGEGPRQEPAGVVHRGEFVVSKPAVQRIGVPALNDLHKRAIRGEPIRAPRGADPVFGHQAVQRFETATHERETLREVNNTDRETQRDRDRLTLRDREVNTSVAHDKSRETLRERDRDRQERATVSRMHESVDRIFGHSAVQRFDHDREVYNQSREVVRDLARVERDRDVLHEVRDREGVERRHDRNTLRELPGRPAPILLPRSDAPASSQKSDPVFTHSVLQRVASDQKALDQIREVLRDKASNREVLRDTSFKLRETDHVFAHPVLQRFERESETKNSEVLRDKASNREVLRDKNPEALHSIIAGERRSAPPSIIIAEREADPVFAHPVIQRFAANAKPSKREAVIAQFDKGGFTGRGGDLEPAGVVHRNEFVFSREAVQRIGVENLGALHQSALPGFANGGLVGEDAATFAPILPRADTYRGKPLIGAAVTMVAAAAQPDSQTVTINAPVTVNGSAGTPQQNNDLARKMARELEGTMRRVVQDEIVRQRRPGNMLSGAKG